MSPSTTCSTGRSLRIAIRRPSAEGVAAIDATGAVGSNPAYAVTDSRTGEVKAVNWMAPALDTVFYRFSKEEVRFILNYGRPFSPMAAWGAPGGGPMTEQNIETLLVYLESIQQQPEGCLTDEAFVNNSDPYVCEGGTVPAATRAAIETSVQNYLEATSFQLGLLVNFGHYPKLEIERIVNTRGRYAQKATE